MVSFTVINRTDEPLEVWGFYEDCHDSPGYRQDYYRVEAVEPRSSILYSTGSSASAGPVACVQAVNSDRQLVLSERYEPGTTYTVRSNTPINAATIPPVDELPSQSWLAEQVEFAEEDPVQFGLGALFILVGLVIIIVLPYGIYRAIRDARNRGRMTTPSEPTDAPPELWS